MKTSKKIITNSLLIISLLLSISCDKDAEQLSISSKVQPETWVEDGILHFKDADAFNKHMNVFETLTDDEKDSFEASLGYVSQRTIIQMAFDAFEEVKTMEEYMAVYYENQEYFDLIEDNDGTWAKPKQSTGFISSICNVNGLYVIDNYIYKRNKSKTFYSKLEYTKAFLHASINELKNNTNINVFTNRVDRKLKSCPSTIHAIAPKNWGLCKNRRWAYADFYLDYGYIASAQQHAFQLEFYTYGKAGNIFCGKQSYKTILHVEDISCNVTYPRYTNGTWTYPTEEKSMTDYVSATEESAKTSAKTFYYVNTGTSPDLSKFKFNNATITVSSRGTGGVTNTGSCGI